MKRPALLASFAIALYCVAWLLPVIRDGGTLVKGVLPGWEAVQFAAVARVDGHEGNWLLTALVRSSAWINLLFPVGAILVARRGPSAQTLRRWAWALSAAALSAAQWLLFAGDERSGFFFGYYAWLASFVLLALALWRLSMDPSVADGGASATRSA